MGDVGRKLRRLGGGRFEGDATYYPGRTVPLNMELSKTAKALEKSGYTVASTCLKKGTIIWIESVERLPSGYPAHRHMALVTDTMRKKKCVGATVVDMSHKLRDAFDSDMKRMGRVRVRVTELDKGDEEFIAKSAEKVCRLPSVLKDWSGCLAKIKDAATRCADLSPEKRGSSRCPKPKK